MQRLPADFQRYIVTVIATAAGLVWILAPQVPWESWPELLLFTVLIGLAAMFPIPDPHGGYITATAVLFYVLLSVHGPGAGLLVGGSAYAAGAAISRGWFPWRTLFNGAQIGISVAIGGLVFKILGGNVEPNLFSFLVPFTIAALAHQMSNNFFVASYYSRLRNSRLFAMWVSDMKDLLWTNFLSILSAAFFAIMYISIHYVTLLLYLLTLPAQRWALQLYIQQRRIFSQAIDSLVVAIDANFPQGRGHSRRVANMSVAIARQLKLSDAAVEVIELGALLHDVGLIGLDEVLETYPSPDGAGVERLRQHVRIGSEIARELPRPEIADIVLCHHERYDGTGYPSGLVGGRIPIGARIVAVSEVYDSMLAGGFPDSQRLSRSEVIEQMKRQTGKAFDPQVIQALIFVFESDQVMSQVFPDELTTVRVTDSSGERQ